MLNGMRNARLHPGTRESGAWRVLTSIFSGQGFILSSKRLWLLSVALYRAGHPSLAILIKNVNSMLYSNSLHPGVSVGADIRLGHHAFGTVIHRKVVIGRGVKIFHNVTMAVRPTDSPHDIVIEDGVVVGASAVIITPRGRGIRIGRGARVGAGAVVTHDVPPRSIVISAPVQVISRDARNGAPAGGDDELDASDDELDAEDGR